MKRYHQILVGFLVIQTALSAVVFWPKSSADGGKPLFPDLDSSSIVALSFTDADGNSIELRQSAGDWVLPDADDYPAEADKITPFLDKLVELNTSRLVTRTDASHEQLQVAGSNFVRRIGFEAAEGEKHILYLGSSPSYGATHFRLDGQSEAYLTSDISSWEVNATAASWINTSYQDVPQADVAKMTLENSSGTFIFTKSDDGKWTMDGLAEDEVLDETKVTAAVRQASSVRMLMPLSKEGRAAYGMDEPNAVVTLETSGKTISLRVGARDPGDSSYVVISSESPYYVRVSEYSVKSLVENTRDDFLQQPATPTPQLTPTPAQDTEA